MTHYIGAFTTVKLDGSQLAVCDTAIFEADYSTEPTCPVCAAWIQRLAQPPSAVVVTRPLGQTSYADCVAAVEDGVLMVRTQSNGYLMDRLEPGKWVECFVFRNGSPVPAETFKPARPSQPDHVAVVREYQEAYARRFGGR
jgi:hypothetical protein